jgi:hypothetical protein
MTARCPTCGQLLPKTTGICSKCAIASPPTIVNQENVDLVFGFRTAVENDVPSSTSPFPDDPSPLVLNPSPVERLDYVIDRIAGTGGRADGHDGGPTSSGEQCIKCMMRTTEGNYYPYYVASKQTISYRVVHEERPFVCHKCAERRLRFTPLVVMVAGTPLFILGSLGILDRILCLVRFGEPIYMPRLFRTLLLVGMAGILLWYALRQLNYVRRRLYQRAPLPDRSVTRMAINLGKKALLKRLRLAASGTIFVAQADRRSNGR